MPEAERSTERIRDTHAGDSASKSAVRSGDTELASLHKRCGNRLVGEILGGDAPDDERRFRCEWGVRSPLARVDAALLQQAVQFRRDHAPQHDEIEIHRTALLGLTGSATPLPHADRIRRSFGAHGAQIENVKAYVGGSAYAANRALGSIAFTRGDAIAFRATPDLHTSAHEAAHVVQQLGGVRLAGGVGAIGDAHEQHADAVADAVVAGRSAEALLGQAARRTAGAEPAVQFRRSPQTEEENEELRREVRRIARHWRRKHHLTEEEDTLLNAFPWAKAYFDRLIHEGEKPSAERPLPQLDPEENPTADELPKGPKQVAGTTDADIAALIERNKPGWAGEAGDVAWDTIKALFTKRYKDVAESYYVDVIEGLRDTHWFVRELAKFSVGFTFGIQEQLSQLLQGLFEIGKALVEVYLGFGAYVDAKLEDWFRGKHSKAYDALLAQGKKGREHLLGAAVALVLFPVFAVQMTVEKFEEVYKSPPDRVAIVYGEYLAQLIAVVLGVGGWAKGLQALKAGKLPKLTREKLGAFLDRLKRLVQKEKGVEKGHFEALVPPELTGMRIVPGPELTDLQIKPGPELTDMRIVPDKPAAPAAVAEPTPTPAITPRAALKRPPPQIPEEPTGPSPEDHTDLRKQRTKAVAEHERKKLEIVEDAQLNGATEDVRPIVDKQVSAGSQTGVQIASLRRFYGDNWLKVEAALRILVRNNRLTRSEAAQVRSILLEERLRVSEQAAEYNKAYPDRPLGIEAFGFKVGMLRSVASRAVSAAVMDLHELAKTGRLFRDPDTHYSLLNGTRLEPLVPEAPAPPAKTRSGGDPALDPTDPALAPIAPNRPPAKSPAPALDRTEPGLAKAPGPRPLKPSPEMLEGPRIAEPARVARVGDSVRVERGSANINGEVLEFPETVYRPPGPGQTALDVAAEAGIRPKKHSVRQAGSSGRTILQSEKHPGKIVKVYTPDAVRTPEWIAQEIQRELAMEEFLAAKGFNPARILRDPELLRRGIIVQEYVEGIDAAGHFRVHGEHLDAVGDLLEARAKLDAAIARALYERFGLLRGEGSLFGDRKLVGIDLGGSFEEPTNIIIDPRTGRPRLVDW